MGGVKGWGEWGECGKEGEWGGVNVGRRGRHYIASFFSFSLA